jgi:hypothetical protein
MSRAATRAATLAALAWLAACATPPQGGTSAGTPAGSGRATEPGTPDVPPAEASLPMDSLLHVRTSELRARFGDPHDQRRDGGAIVWNYEADGVCRLNLVLQGVRGTPAEVVHAQARMAPGGTEATCFDRLRQEARVSSAPVLETVATAPPPPPPAPRPPPARPRARPRASQRKRAQPSRHAQPPPAAPPSARPPPGRESDAGLKPPPPSPFPSRMARWRPA